MDETPVGRPLPPDDPHAISVSLPTWRSHVAWGMREEWILREMRCGYPRFFIPLPVHKLSESIAERHVHDCAKQSVIPFTTEVAARRCADFLQRFAPPPSSSSSSSSSSEDDEEFRILHLVIKSPEAHGCLEWRKWTTLFAVVYPKCLYPTLRAFWQHSGECVSTRHTNLLQQLWDHGAYSESRPNLAKLITTIQISEGAAAKSQIRSRIASFYSSVGVKESDVLLYPTGMSALSSLHHVLLELMGQKRSVVFGFPYTDTSKVLTKWGPGCQFYGHGDEADWADLLLRLRSGETFSSIFCETPSNPLLRAPDLKRIRELADKWGMLVVVDDTVGTAVNVDVLGRGMADVVVSSLSKSFSGRCNVMGGSLVANPHGKSYSRLLSTLKERNLDMLYPLDAVVIEQNSRGWSTRVQQMNYNAEALVDLLSSNHLVEKVYYPTTDPTTTQNYDQYRRESGGYGELFTVTFKDSKVAEMFLDKLKVAKGPSLGTNFTLASAYTILGHFHELEWAAGYGVDEYFVRVSVGIEETGALVEVFKNALKEAEESSG